MKQEEINLIIVALWSVCLTVLLSIYFVTQRTKILIDKGYVQQESKSGMSSYWVKGAK